MQEKREKRVAVLIDGDNISPKYAEYIKQEATRIGRIIIFRLYGSVSSPSVRAWYSVMPKYGIIPMLQICYSHGKSIADQALTIDAMDILYGSEVDTICLVTSDSDFTKLAYRIRESGKMLIGMGEKKTNQSFAQACDEFKVLDLIYRVEETEAPEETKKAKAAPEKPQEKTGKRSASEKAREKTQKAAKPAAGHSESRPQTAAEAPEAPAKKAPVFEIIVPAEPIRPAEAGKKLKEPIRPAEPILPTETMLAADLPEDDLLEEDVIGEAEMLREAREIDIPSEEEILTLIEDALEDDWENLANIGISLSKQIPGFDARNYGYKNMTRFIKGHKNRFYLKFETSRDRIHSVVYVRKKPEQNKPVLEKGE